MRWKLHVQFLEDLILKNILSLNRPYAASTVVSYHVDLEQS